MKKRLVFAGSAALVFAALLVFWRLLILAFDIPGYLLPTPLAVVKISAQRLPELWSSLLISGEAAVGGLIAAIAVGPGLLAVGVVTFVICLAPIIANTTQGLVSVDENLVQLFLMHNASQGQILSRLRLPHALPYLFVGVRISSGIAVIGALTGEWFAGSGRAGQGGLGYSILYAQAQLQTAYLFALVIAATLLGFTLFFTVMFFEWLALHKWHESAFGTDASNT
jgi:NitT/TauT family transport system permease protein